MGTVEWIIIGVGYLTLMILIVGMGLVLIQRIDRPDTKIDAGRAEVRRPDAKIDNVNAEITAELRAEVRRLDAKIDDRSAEIMAQKNLGLKSEDSIPR